MFIIAKYLPLFFLHLSNKNIIIKIQLFTKHFIYET